MNRKVVGLLAVLMLAASCSAASAASPPLPAPSEFAPRVDNPWFPLRPGTVHFYRGRKDGAPTRERVAVLDRSGNVWYLGEATAEIGPDGGVVSREGSWQAGVDGARAGIFMPARPRPGDTGQQELYAGHAEDRFRVLSRSARVSTPAVSSRRALLVREWTPLEPGVVDRKLYVRGTGLVLEQAVKGGDELNELVAIRR